MATLSQALPKAYVESILIILKTQTSDKGHFERNYRLVEEKQRAGSFGNIAHVRSRETEVEYAIKKVVIREESNAVIHNILLQTLQESALHGLLGPEVSLIKAHPKLNWIVLPDEVDALDVTEVLDRGENTPLDLFRRFLGKFLCHL